MGIHLYIQFIVMYILQFPCVNRKSCTERIHIFFVYYKYKQNISPNWKMCTHIKYIDSCQLFSLLTSHTQLNKRDRVDIFRCNFYYL